MKVVGYLLCCFLVLVSLSFCFSSQAEKIPSVLGEGRSSLVSVNMFPLLAYYAGSGSAPNRSEAIEKMTAACQRGFTFIRFAGTLFWPLWMRQTYLSDRNSFWKAWRQLVVDAKSCGCKLMPSIFWNEFLFADLSGEHLGEALRDPGSKTLAAMTTYITELVTEFSSDETIVAWELANEWNLLLDLDMEGKTPSCYPPLGTPASRTKADNMSTEEYIQAANYFTSLIRKFDKLRRPISSGNSIPRPAAQHLRNSYYAPKRDWTPDSESEFKKNLVDVGAPFDWISVHLYNNTENYRFGFRHVWNLFTPIREALAPSSKLLYCGEFGDQSPGVRTFSLEMIGGFRATDVPLATIWIWEYKETSADPFSIWPSVDQNLIDAMIAYNKAHA